MTRGQVIDELGLSLLDFVKRASNKKATSEEVEALPRVAEVLVDLLELTKD